MPEKHINATEAMRLLHKSDKTIRAWLKKGKFPGAKRVEMNGIEQWSIPMEDIQALQKTSEPIPDTPNLAVEIEEIKRRLTVLENAMSIGISKPRSDVPEKKLHKSSAAPGSLPDGYVPLIDFAKQHGIATTTLYRFVEDREIETTSGTWVYKHHSVTRALSEEQQALFYEKMHTHKSFKRCDVCPHILTR